ncbi:MAG: RdgB/HAM1 family non-canonical purine NTP pyrophosphatase [Psychrobacter sp.]|nr:RdgB/HAM1 family non-canonical purine NTP pyrophosphatase [Psychrobacter sp.]
MVKKIIFATGNQNKMREIREIMGNLPVEILSMKEAGIGADITEDGTTFEENAAIKAKAVAELLPEQDRDTIVLADDSGLEIDALNGEPGIYSARYAGEHGNDAKNNAKLIADLQPIRAAKPDTPIKGMFVCVLAMVRHADDPLPIIAQGLWHGEILDAPHGDGGFGYDPLFWLPELQATAASLSATDKNSISHRGQAIEQLLAQLPL